MDKSQGGGWCPQWEQHKVSESLIKALWSDHVMTTTWGIFKNGYIWVFTTEEVAEEGWRGGSLVMGRLICEEPIILSKSSWSYMVIICACRCSSLSLLLSVLHPPFIPRGGLGLQANRQILGCGSTRGTSHTEAATFHRLRYKVLLFADLLLPSYSHHFVRLNFP